VINAWDCRLPTPSVDCHGASCAKELWTSQRRFIPNQFHPNCSTFIPTPSWKCENLSMNKTADHIRLSGLLALFK
jgi:hypothetical protein